MPRLPCFRLMPLILIAASSMAAGEAAAQRVGVEASSNRAGAGERGADAARRAADHHHDRSAEQRALSAAVRRVESQTGGQVLSAERIPYDGRDVSRVKVVDASGRVRVYMDDPQSPRGPAGRSIKRAPTRGDDN